MDSSWEREKRIEHLSDLRLIVGLGNPGKDYEYHRHNLGFLVLRFMAEKLNFGFETSSCKNGLTAEGSVGGRKICLFLPLTYMNHSGIAVKKVVIERMLEFNNILVVCDDFNLDFGQLRLRANGSDGGHNGLDSIIQYLGTKEFPRLRLGIGRPPCGQDPADYVLKDFKRKERESLGDFISRASDCCLVWFNDGISKAMDQFNMRVKEENGKG